jgi:hypothetical protein
MRIAKYVGITLAGVMLFLGACAAPVIKRTAGAAPVSEPPPSLSKISIPLAPAAFSTSELTVSTAVCNQGGEVWVGVTVKNTGGQVGSYPAVVKLNGEVVRTANVTLNAGASENIYFVLNQQADMPDFSVYKITIDNLEKDVEVL